MRILVAVEPTEYAEIVLEHALDEAVRAGSADLHFVTIVDTDDKIATTRSWLDAAVRDALDEFDLPSQFFTLHVWRGQPTQSIAALADELQADLVVIGRFSVPSVSDALVAITERPVLVVGIDGPVLEPQCPACRAVRAASGGEHLFCDAHSGGRLPELSTRLPPATDLASRMW
jgi:nucleotide-binding universal stress UspA family protein